MALMGAYSASAGCKPAPLKGRLQLQALGLEVGQRYLVIEANFSKDPNPFIVV